MNNRDKFAMWFLYSMLGLLLIALMFGCGSNSPLTGDVINITSNEPPTKYTSPQLKPIVDEFFQDAKARNMIIGNKYKELNRIELGDARQYAKNGEAYVGVCIVGEVNIGIQTQNYRHIVIDNSALKMGKHVLKGILYHELFHCVWDIGHSEDKYDLMYPYTYLSDESTEAMWNIMLDKAYDDVRNSKNLIVLN